MMDYSINKDYSTATSAILDENDYAHSEDGPALVYHRGGYLEVYCIHGAAHREDGPAKIFYDQHMIEWHLNNKCVPFKEFCAQTNKTPKEIALLLLTWVGWEDGWAGFFNK